MAEETLDSELFILTNKWGPPHPSFSNTIPIGTGKWDGATSQNVEVPLFLIGTVIQHFHKGTKDGATAGQSGFYQMA